MSNGANTNLTGIPNSSITPIVDCSFVKTGSGLIADETVQLGNVGSGMTVGQAFSNLNIDTGTNPGSEFLFRSNKNTSGAHILRYRMSKTQHIVNQHSWAMLADIVGEGVPFTVDGTGLVITVTLPAGHGFTSENVGQTCMLGGVVGAALSHPGRYSITAVVGNDITFSPVFSCTWTRSSTTATISFQGGAPIFSLNETATVSNSSDTAAIVNGAVTLLTQGNSNNLATSTFTCLNAGATSGTLTLTMSAKAWTPSASGTLTVYGWNYVAIIKNGTSATAAWKDTQRKGWSSGAATMTKTTDVQPLGVIDQMYGDCQIEAFSDVTPASQSTSLSVNARATSIDSLPLKDTPLYFFFSVSNGVTAPASTTRYSLGFFRILDININKVQISGFDNSGYNMYNDVRVASMPSLTIGTMPSSTPVAGTAAHDAAQSGNPVRVATRARSSNYTAVANDDVTELLTDLNGRIVVQLGQIPQLQDLNRVTTTAATETTLIAAVASVRHGIHKLTIANRDVAAHTVDVRDTTAGTIRETVIIPAGQTYTAVYPHGLWQSAVNTNWTFQCRAAPTTAVEVSAQSFRVGF